MLDLTGGNRTVPVIVEEDKPVQVCWRGQGCFVQKSLPLRGLEVCGD
jgi:hypothetical protein